MATATQLMPSPTTGLKSAFSPYTDSPSSPATFAQVFSNRCRSLLQALHPAQDANGQPKVLRNHVGPPGSAAESLSCHCRPLARRQQWHERN